MSLKAWGDLVACAISHRKSWAGSSSRASYHFTLVLALPASVLAQTIGNENKDAVRNYYAPELVAWLAV
jgi:hypothetical protein